MADQEAVAQCLEAASVQTTGEARVKREPIKTIILDDTPPPAANRVTTPSTLPNWLKRKAPVIKKEAPESPTELKKTGQKMTPIVSSAQPAEGPAQTPALIQTTVTSAATVMDTIPETKQEADTHALAETAEVATKNAPLGGDMEVEEVGPPATEPGTLVFPKVRSGWPRHMDCTEHVPGAVY